MSSARLLINGNLYDLSISGAGAAILLLHGFSGDKSTWQALRGDLEAEYTVIAIDILGHGASAKPSQVAAYRMENVAADIVGLLDELALGPSHLLGYSLGGRLALYLALYFADRFASLILESASPGLAGTEGRAERRRRDNALAQRIEDEGIEWFVKYWEDLALWQSQRNLPTEVLQSQRHQRLLNDPRGLANNLRGMGTGAQPNLWPQLPNLKHPTQLIVGELDRKFRIINEAMNGQMPNARLSLVPAAGHNTHLESPAEFHQRVLSFLRSL